MRSRIVCIVPIYKASASDLKRILNMQIGIDELIIVDDSGDNFSEYIRLQKCRFCVKYCFTQDLGLSKAINKALSIAINDGADWVLILNQDSHVHYDFVSVYSKFISRNNCDEVSILAPKHSYDRHKRKPSKGYSRIRYSDLAGCLFNVRVIKQIGMFDEFFFIDGLDTEWCLRSRRYGYNIIRCNKAVIDHKPGRTRTITINKKIIFMYGWHSYERYYYQFLAGFYIHRKYHDLYSDLFLFMKFCKVILLFDGKKQYLRSIKKAFLDYRLWGKNDKCNNSSLQC